MDPKLRGTKAKYEEMWVETSGDSWETVMAKVGSEECPWNIGNLVKDKSNRRTQYFYCKGCGRKGRLKEMIIGDEVVFETVGDSCDCEGTTHGLPDTTKNFMADMYGQGFITVGQQMNRMRQLKSRNLLPPGFVMPLEKKVVGHWKTLLRKVGDKDLLDLKPTPTTLQTFVLSHTWDPNRHHDNEACVFGYETDIAPDGSPVFRICMSTKRLIDKIM